LKWGRFNKNDDTVKEHVWDAWYNLLADSRPRNWDREEINFDGFQTEILEWEEDMPNLAVTAIPELMKQFAEEDLFEDLKDRRFQFVHKDGPAGERIKNEDGELIEELRVNRLEQLFGSTEEFVTLLMSKATSDEYNTWDVENDDLDDALNRVYMESYHNAFYEAVGTGTPQELKGSARKILYRDWTTKDFPGGPDIVQLTGWIREKYGDKWTDDEIVLHVYGTDVIDMELRQEQQRTERQNQADKIYEYYGWAGPRGQKDALYDALPSETANLLRDFVDPSKKPNSSAKSLWNYWPQDLWDEFYTTVSTAAMDLDLAEPTMDMLEEWELYESLDNQLNTFREDKYGPDWDGLQREYYNTPYGDERLQWRKDNPDEYKRLEAGWTMEKAFGKQHPAWLKYEDYEAWEGKATAKTIATGTSSSYDVGSTVSLGQGMYRHSIGPGIYRDDYSGITLDELFKTARVQMPAAMRPLEISRLALDELLAGDVSPETEAYLKKLHEKVAAGITYDNFIKRILELAKAKFGVEPAITQNIIWPWMEGYSEAGPGPGTGIGYELGSAMPGTTVTGAADQQLTGDIWGSGYE
jgi:hypothetical protein